MFHANSHAFFGRRSDGSVRVLKLKHEALPGGYFPKADDSVEEAVGKEFVEFDQTFDADSWASIVASVSAFGGQDGRFYAAKAFHDGKAQEPWNWAVMSPDGRYALYSDEMAAKVMGRPGSDPFPVFRHPVKEAPRA